MTALNLHPDILAAENKDPHGTGKILRIWPVDPQKPLLITFEYECNCTFFGRIKNILHSHAATYGPRILQWADDCLSCGLHKWANHGGHEYVATGEEKVDPDHYELYAD